MDEFGSLGFVSQSTDFDPTQVMYCFDNEAPTNSNDILFEQSIDNIPTNEAPEVKYDFDKGVAFPEMPDDEDDFSWLMTVRPAQSCQNDQTVPSEEFQAIDSATNFNSITRTKEASPLPPAEESVSMLVDVMLSEMDVSSLITNDVGEMTFHKNEEKNDGIKEKPELAHDNMKSLKSHRKKRSDILRNRTTTALTETPISLRRSKRKRSYKEMIQTEVNIIKTNKTTGSGRRNNNKRPRMQSTPGESKTKNNDNDNTSVTVTLSHPEPVTGNNTLSQPEPDAVTPDIKPMKNELKIKFRKSKAVNHFDRSLISNRSFQKGLIDPSKILSGEMYLTSSCSSKYIPNVEEDIASKWIAKPIVPKKVKELLKIEWITNHNTLANAKAHGQEILGNKKLTSDGNAVRGTFVTMDLDNEYNKILQFQNEMQCVMDWKSNLLNKTHNLTDVENSINLDISFSNFSNFNNYFPEQLQPSPINVDNDDDDDTERSTHRVELNDSIVGAVPVNMLALSNSSNVLCQNWSVFKIKGQHYRSNPGVVIVERLPDHVIEQIKSRPKKVTLQSPYYKALTSYFETRSNL